MLLILCVVLGGIGVLVMKDAFSGGGQGLPPAQRTSVLESDLKHMSQGELRAEIKRLEGLVAERDREIADLKIRLTLTNEGSRTK